MNNTRWKVHKFGGTSVLNAERYRSVFKILSELPSGPKATVVSAMKGVTDDLIKTVELARTQQESYKTLLQTTQERHRTEIGALLDAARGDALLKVFAKDFDELTEILRGCWLIKEAAPSIVDRVSGMGEVWSAQILNAYFEQQNVKTAWLDARQVLVVKHVGQRVIIDWEISRENLEAWKKQNPVENIVITGFVASTEAGAMTTLGRNGSDYSASIFGSLFDSDEIVIWTDVDGILSADPSQIPEAIVLNEMSYNEVTELAYFGAKVVHPATMAPAVEKQIPIWIKNTFNPQLPGTRIHGNAKSNRTVTGFSTIHNMALLNLEGTGMVGIIGVAERMFSTLRQAGVNVVLISQASSEQSICVAVSDNQGEIAKAALEQAFSIEIQKGFIHPLEVVNGVSILAAVGDNMARSPGVAGRFFTALGQSGVNVRAIAQGSSERNISIIVDTKDAGRALRNVHSSFILPHQRVSLGLIGPGLIGGTFLKQLAATTAGLRENRKVDFQVRAIADSKKMYLSENEIPLDNWKSLFEENSEPLDMKKFSAHVKSSHIPHAVIIESTASAALVPNYKEWLLSGIHVISPNKKANTGPMKDYVEIRNAARASGRHFLYSTNVGAGLPVIQTLRDLCATGDRVFAIHGMLSGTLSYIFNQYDGSQPFSEIVMQAKAKGFTEPDPRDDLSGQDVMRKLVILAREAGLQVEIADVEVKGLVPNSLTSLSLDEFMNRIGELDVPMSEKLKAARGDKKILRFVASLDNEGKARVGLEALPESHAFARGSGTDNMVLFQTQRYFEQPLVIQGPGAGPEVTAAGVFADLLRLSQYLGAIP